MTKQLTKEQAIIITGYTGILCGEWSDFHADVEKRLNRGIQTFEFGIQSFWNELKEIYREDFIATATIEISTDVQEEREVFEQHYHQTHSPIICRPYPVLENGDYKYIEIDKAWKLWQAAKDQAPKWISVDDEIPKDGELVLSLSTKKLNSHNVYNISDLDDFESERTTHWMPLPALPKGEEE